MSANTVLGKGGRSSGRSGHSSYYSYSGYSGGSSGSAPWWVSLIVIFGIILLAGIVLLVVASVHNVHPCRLFGHLVCCKKKELVEMR